jgi:CPA1 family monovalent cation:H+ antiporter
MESFYIQAIAEVIVGLLFLASLVAILVRRLRMPYTVTLVVVGLGSALLLAGSNETAFFNVNALRILLVPEVIMALLVPPLIFEAASHINFRDLFRDLPLVLAFAIPGMVLTMLLVGGIVYWWAPLTIEMALVFGALIAATDPVAVVALFRSMGVPKRLTVLLEGESLFNDGTAIVVYNLMLAVVIGSSELTAKNIVLDFITVAVGGLLIGILLSTIISRIIRQVDDHLIEITLTIVTAYGSYLVAETFHTSGVLAVVAAGLVIGNIGPRGMAPTTRIAISTFWEYAAFLANSLVFLVIGLVIDLHGIISNIGIILLAILAVLAARAAIIYSFSAFSRKVERRIQHVLWWGGLRGAISLALALGLPTALNTGIVAMGIAGSPQAELLTEMASLIQVMAYGVVLFTLVVQGTTMRGLVSKLQLAQRTPSEIEYEQNQARAVAAQTAYRRLRGLNEEGLISDHAWTLIEPPMIRAIDARTQAVAEVLNRDRSMEVAELGNAYQEALRAQRSAYHNLLASGVISEESFSHLVAEVDTALLNQQVNYGDLLLLRSPDLPPVTQMLAAVIHEDDLNDTLSMLNILGIPSTRLESTQAGEKGRYVTLLMGVDEEQMQEVINSIISCCSEPVKSTPALFNLLPMNSSNKVKIGESHIYVIEVERYEEF